MAKTFNASASYEFLYHVRGDEHLFAVVDVHQGTGMSVLQRVDGQGSLRFEMILEPNGGIMFRCWNEDRLRDSHQALATQDPNLKSDNANIGLVCCAILIHHPYPVDMHHTQ